MIEIKLNASELAIITGHNKYQNLLELKDKIFIRNNLKEGIIPTNDVHKILLNIKNPAILKDLKLDLKLSDDSSIKTIVKTLQNKYIKPAVSNNTEAGSHEVLQSILTASPAINKLLGKSLYKDLIKSKGNKNESKSLNKHEKVINTRITGRNNTLYKKHLYSDDKYKIIIQGKIDGMINNDTVVESKNRSKRLFHKIPEYEKVQLEAYLFLTNTDRALHIENYNDHSVETYYYTNSEFWNYCISKIIDFVVSFNCA